MQASDLKPAGDFARQYGVKSIAYGPPGVGKTPIINTAPNPVLLITEPGMLSMRGSTVPAFEAPTPQRVEEFFDWLFGSAESRKFDTVAMDSVSQWAEAIVSEELNKRTQSGNKADGKAAYGKMSERVMKRLNQLYFMQNKHTYLICKQTYVELQGVNSVAPSFPGKDLYTKVPHLYDAIFHVDRVMIPGMLQEQVALRTKGSLTVMARDRSGRLAEFEPPNLAAVFAKAMS
jgi:hypothetical protein